MPTKRPGKKTGAQLNREIAAALRTPPRSKARAKISHLDKPTRFVDLLRDDDPNAMQVAEDLVLERGWKLREMGGSLHARNFTFDMKPLWTVPNQWKMVQVSVDNAGRAFPGRMVAEYSIANGTVRIKRTETHANHANETKKAAVATAWAIAKAIKPLPLDTDQKTVEHVVDEVIDNGLDNMHNEELF